MASRLEPNFMIRLNLVLLSSLCLAACGDTTPSTTTDNKASTATEETSAASTQVSSSAETQTSDYQEIAWEDLELPGQGMADIMRKYQPLLDKISDSDTAASDELMDKMQAEFNAAPVNPALNNKKIKLSGFVSPLEVDDTKGQVKEFLLVPYFGACIHVPPPPLNQIILVRPESGKSINMEQIYEPVTVTGVLSTETIKTNLAQAGYQIKAATVVSYQEPVKTQ